MRAVVVEHERDNEQEDLREELQFLGGADGPSQADLGVCHKRPVVGICGGDRFSNPVRWEGPQGVQGEQDPPDARTGDGDPGSRVEAEPDCLCVSENDKYKPKQDIQAPSDVTEGKTFRRDLVDRFVGSDERQESVIENVCGNKPYLADEKDEHEQHDSTGGYKEYASGECRSQISEELEKSSLG